MLHTNINIIYTIVFVICVRNVSIAATVQSCLLMSFREYYRIFYLLVAFAHPISIQIKQNQLQGYFKIRLSLQTEKEIYIFVASFCTSYILINTMHSLIS